MKYVDAAFLAAALVASGWAVNAHAGDGYSDPSDLRTSGVVVSSSTATIKSSDGSTNGADPYGMRTPGVAFVNPTAQLASQPIHRTQPTNTTTQLAGHRAQPLVGSN